MDEHPIPVSGRRALLAYFLTCVDAGDAGFHVDWVFRGLSPEERSALFDGFLDWTAATYPQMRPAIRKPEDCSAHIWLMYLRQKVAYEDIEAVRAQVQPDPTIPMDAFLWSCTITLTLLGFATGCVVLSRSDDLIVWTAILSLLCAGLIKPARLR